MTGDSKSSTAGPVTWPEVIAEFAPLYREGLEMFDELPQELASSKPPQYAGGRLGGFDSTLAGLAALCGPDEVLGALAPVSSGLAHAIGEIGATIDRNSARPAFYTLNVLNVARCVGAPAPRGSADLEQQWLPQLTRWMGNLNEREHHTLALAACAASLPALVPVFTGAGTLPERFEPGEVHGFNVPAFAGYIAAAIGHAGSYQDVEPAWLDFVHNFPFKLDTEMLGWPALLWAARAVYGTIGQLPENEIAPELHRLVTGA